MNNDLLVPITALRRMPLQGLLVIRTDGGHRWGGLVYDASGDERLVVATSETFGGARPGEWPREGWSLDFGESATRDRAARWLAWVCGVADGSSIAPDWIATRRYNVNSRPAGGSWALYADRIRHFAATERMLDEKTAVPELAGIDPHDGQRIADGSRRVDAAALAVVCSVAWDRWGGDR